MEQVHKVDVDARACCTLGKEVWVAKRQGGLRILNLQGDASSPEDIAVAIDGEPNTQVACLAAVFDEVWLATVGGQLLFMNAKERRVCAVPLRLPGESQRAALTDMCFNGHVVTVASEVGTVFVVHPLTKRVLHTLSTTSPCTAVAQFYSFVVAGDRSGALYVWDVLEGELVVRHPRATSEVTHILHERSTGTIWASRRNGQLDVYRLDAHARALVLVKRVAAVGTVTALVEVSGMVLVTTYEREVVLIDAASAEVKARDKAAHASFVSGAAKTVRQETAQVWTLGHTGGACVWSVRGAALSACLPPFLPPRDQARLVSSTHDDTVLRRAELGVLVQETRGTVVTTQDELRRALEEAQEMRLRVIKLEEAVHAKEAQVLQRDSTLKELEASQAKLTKELTDLSSKVSTVEREGTTLQGELSTAREDASKARSEAATKQTEKLKADQEASQLRADKSNAEQRLRDAESRVADLQAENKRLCASIGDVTIAQKAEHDVQQRILQGSANLSEELDRTRHLNTLMGAALASTVYTIRRKEEEGRDLTALLNAFRRKVADHVTDPYLSALLLVTMVRNPPRFELDCDDYTKSQLMDRHGPFIQFLQQLQLTDADAYDKLIQYLQNTDRTTIAPETRDLLDRFVSVAQRDGEVNADLVATLKRSIPNMVGTSADGQVGGLHLNPQSSAPPTAAGGGVATAGSTGQPTSASATNTGSAANASSPATATSATTGPSSGTSATPGKEAAGATVLGAGSDFATYLRALNAEKVKIKPIWLFNTPISGFLTLREPHSPRTYLSSR